LNERQSLNYSTDQPLGQCRKGPTLEIQGHGLLEAEQLLGACSHISDGFGCSCVWFLAEHVDMIGLSWFLPHSGLNVDVISRFGCHGSCLP